MNDPEYEYSETMNELVRGLASLQDTRKSIEDGMNRNAHVRVLTKRKATLKHQLDDIDAELMVECSDSTRELAQIDRDIAEAKSGILGVWNGKKRTVPYGELVLSLKGRKSVIIENGGGLLADLMKHFSADRIAKDFVATFNKTNLKSFIALHPQDESVARIEEKIYVYVNPNSKPKEE